MATGVQMPKLGNTVEECLIAAWRKGVGDRVSEGEVVADIETDKAAFEIESPADGEILELFFEEGDLVPVLVNICAVGESGDDIDELRPSEDDLSQSESPEEVSPDQAAADAAPDTQGVVSAGVAVTGAVAESMELSPRAKRLLNRHPLSVDLSKLRGSGADGRIIEKDIRDAFHGGGSKLSPVAAKMVEEGKFAPARGTGVGGMVLSGDLTDVAPVSQREGVEIRPLSNLRKMIGDRMKNSLDSTAQYTLSAEADVSAILKLRKDIKAGRADQDLGDANITDLLLFVTIQALLDYPELNAELLEDGLHVHEEVHMAVACDTDRGLVVPVMRSAQKLTPGEISLKVRELAEGAREGTLLPDDLSGGSFTVSTLGSLGISTFTPVLNFPQVAILGIGGISLKPVKTEHGIEFVEHISLSLTCNHMVIDGAPGARFLGALADRIAAFRYSKEN